MALFAERYTRAGSRTWGETYTRPPKFATTTAAGGRVITGSGDLAVSRELFFLLGMAL